MYKRFWLVATSFGTFLRHFPIYAFLPFSALISVFSALRLPVSAPSLDSVPDIVKRYIFSKLCLPVSALCLSVSAHYL
jgi:hypothetical protein